MLLLISVTSLLHSGNTPAVQTPPRPAPTHALSVSPTDQGDILRLRLTSAPFPHPRRQDGYQFEQTRYPADPHYVDSTVIVFVPGKFRAASRVNLVFFFHGWNSSIDDAQQKFDLYRQFSQSGVQALLVLPELAWNAPDSFGGKLEEKGGFTRLVDELLEALSENGVISTRRAGSILLAGHSGAYRVIGKILMNGDLAPNIREICLFDALYDFTDQYSAWIQNQTGRFVAVSSADSEQTSGVNELIADLKADRIAFQVAPDDPVRDSRALKGRVAFLQSDSDHYGVVCDRDEFRRLLDANPVLMPFRRPLPSQTFSD